MANVLLVEGWGLAGSILSDVGPAMPPKLTALGWQVSRGNATSGQAGVTVDQGRMTVSSGNTTTGTGVAPFRNLPNLPGKLAAGWASDASWALTGVAGPGFAFHTSPLTDRSPATPLFSVAIFLIRRSDDTLQVCSNNTSAAAYSPAVPAGFVAGVDNWVELVVDRVNSLAEVWVNNFKIQEWPLPHSVASLTDGAFCTVITNSTNIPGFNGVIPVGDAYVADERLGRCQVITRRPTVDAQAEFNRTQGDSNASQVADPDGSDGDASYVRSSQTGDEDRYSSADPLGLTNERVHAVAVTVAGRKEDVGIRSITPVVERSGTAVAGNAVFLDADSYRGVQSVFSVDPATGIDWTLSAAENHTFGVRLTE